MKPTIICILILIICSCGRTKKKEIPEKFIIGEYSISMDTSILTTIFYKEHFYCLTENHSIVCLNKNFQVDSAITHSIKNLKFEFLFEEGDTLFAGLYENDKNYKVYYLDDNLNWETPLSTRDSKPFYEDDKFLISECCAGEFGGAIYFKERNTENIYGCRATCPVYVNRINNIYYVTNSLAHMSGSTQIYRIKDPTKLERIHPDTLERCCNCLHSTTGIDNIYDTVGLITMMSFVEKNELFTVLTGYSEGGGEETLLYKLNNDKMVLIKKISNKCLWTRHPRIKRYGATSLHSFSNDYYSGFITIKNDTISVVTNKHRKE